MEPQVVSRGGGDDEILARLLATVDRESARVGVSLPPDELAPVLQRIVDAMRAENALDETSIQLAEANLSRLVLEYQRVGGSRMAYAGEDVTAQASVEDVVDGLCPGFWPIC
jgi:hypothetical protein